MIFKDYYKILGFDDNKVTPEQIKTAYREQAKKYHPDVNVRNTEERFKDINEAYRTLSDSATRRRYDRAWKTNIGRRKNREKYAKNDVKDDGFKSSLFSLLFGTTIKEQEKSDKKDTKIPTKGEDVETEIEITLEEAFYGKTKKIALRTVDGNMRNITVKVPSGIRNNERIRLIGQGKKDKKDDKPGDLFIKVKVLPNNNFKLKGYDLYTNIEISPWQAALGDKIKIKGIDEEANIEISKCTSSGEQIEINDLGFRDGKGKRGKLICTVNIKIPKELSNEQEELYKMLKKIEVKNVVK